MSSSRHGFNPGLKHGTSVFFPIIGISLLLAFSSLFPSDTDTVTCLITSRLAQLAAGRRAEP